MLALVSGPVGIRKEGPPAARSLLYADDIVLPLLASSGIERVCIQCPSNVIVGGQASPGFGLGVLPGW